MWSAGVLAPYAGHVQQRVGSFPPSFWRGGEPLFHFELKAGQCVGLPPGGQDAPLVDLLDLASRTLTRLDLATMEPVAVWTSATEPMPVSTGASFPAGSPIFRLGRSTTRLDYVLTSSPLDRRQTVVVPGQTIHSDGAIVGAIYRASFDTASDSGGLDLAIATRVAEESASLFTVAMATANNGDQINLGCREGFAQPFHFSRTCARTGTTSDVPIDLSLGYFRGLAASMCCSTAHLGLVYTLWNDITGKSRVRALTAHDMRQGHMPLVFSRHLEFPATRYHNDVVRVLVDCNNTLILVYLRQDEIDLMVFDPSPGQGTQATLSAHRFYRLAVDGQPTDVQLSPEGCLVVTSWRIYESSQRTTTVWVFF